MIDKLRKCNTIEEIVKKIKEFYVLFNDEYYIPGIYREGSLITSLGLNADFYAKLIIRPKNLKLESSWLKGAVEGNFVDGSSKIDVSDYIYNLITQKKYYNNELYTLNPCLTNCDGYIYEKIQDDKLVCNQVYFNSSFSTNEWPVLIAENEDQIMVFKQAIKEYINTGISYPQYILSVEFEYRDAEHIIKEKDNVKSDNYYIYNSTGEDRTNLVGTIDLDFVLPEFKSLNIYTNGINGEVRKINENNWNDDVDAGLIVFNKKCLKYLKERYIFVEYHMIDLFNQKDVLVDVLESYIVFWEGEFNQLPYEIKKELEKYNIAKKCSGIISKPMYEWQLIGNINYDEFESNYMKIAKHVFENHKYLARELKTNFDIPSNKYDLINRVENLVKIYNININDISMLDEPKKILDKIINTTYMSNKREIREVYEYFCFRLLEVIK